MVRIERKTRLYRPKGFTYIELLITLVVLAVLFVPVMQLFSYSLHATGVSRDLITATNLAKWQIEKIKNLNVSKEQLRSMGDEIYPPAEEEPLEMNSVKWRIKKEIIAKTNPLEIRVHAYYDGYEKEPIVTLITLIEDMTWEEIRPVR